ncbi:MAG: HEPN domain-containing protein [ANME-2 cluster archaeon]|nr:HEPN domain-containing protein [ANME-2 cluster archaeon]MBC2709134.1 HEPN domain-containing protein [ANME-2 cluster archaeon]
MKKMILKWWKQANRDLLTAKNCIGSGDYYASVFFSEQAIEKGLKALYIKLFNDAPPRIHYIDKLASLVNAPLDIMDATYELSEDYMLSRYPDVSDELPFELYDEYINVTAPATPATFTNEKKKVTIQPYINVIVRLNSLQIDNCTQLSNTFENDELRLSIKN